ncbi:MAG TPA: FAD-binding oxidoreductase [Nitriliruptoraceae bacterium]|nr:FAD-binding oxidoreductase [Nitriliruptoraceae bacterium]
MPDTPVPDTPVADTPVADTPVADSPVAHDRAGAPLWTEPHLVAGEPATPSLEEDAAVDLCVVGLGGTGLAAVEAGLEAGLRVVGIDAGPIAGAAAGRNGGLLLAGMAAFHHDAVQRHGRHRARAWYEATLAQRDRMVADDPRSLRVTGSLRVAADTAEAQDLDAQATAMQRDDLPVDRVASERGPALLFPGDAVSNPADRCRRMARRLVDGGARLAAHTAAQSIGSGVVVTEHASVSAPTILVCVDGGLGRVVPSLAARVRPFRLQMAGTSPTATVVDRPVYRRWGLDYWQQLPTGELAIGGGRDHGGADEQTDDAVTTAPVQAWIDVMAASLAPDATVTHRWAAIVGYTDDGMPACAEVADGVWAVGGYSGTGNVVGPMLARELVAWSQVGHPSALLGRLGVH